MATVNALRLRVVQGEPGVHREGGAVARVVAEPQQPAGGRTVIYVFGEHREKIAKLIAAAPDLADTLEGAGNLIESARVLAIANGNAASEHAFARAVELIRLALHASGRLE